MRLPKLVRRVDDPDELRRATRTMQRAVVLTVLVAFVIATVVTFLDWSPAIF